MTNHPTSEDAELLNILGNYEKFLYYYVNPDEATQEKMQGAITLVQTIAAINSLYISKRAVLEAIKDEDLKTTAYKPAIAYVINKRNDAIRKVLDLEQPQGQV